MRATPTKPRAEWSIAGECAILLESRRTRGRPGPPLTLWDDDACSPSPLSQRPEPACSGYHPARGSAPRAPPHSVRKEKGASPERPVLMVGVASPSFVAA